MSTFISMHARLTNVENLTHFLFIYYIVLALLLFVLFIIKAKKLTQHSFLLLLQKSLLHCCVSCVAKLC